MAHLALKADPISHLVQRQEIVLNQKEEPICFTTKLCAYVLTINNFFYLLFTTKIPFYVDLSCGFSFHLPEFRFLCVRMWHSAGARKLTWLLTDAIAVTIFPKICWVETTRIFGHCSVLSFPDEVN